MADFYNWIPWLAFIVFVILCTEIWLRNRGLPPGPCGFPILGCYPYLRSRPNVKLAEWAEKYGEIISFRSAGGNLFVVLNRLPVVKEVFLDRADEFIGRPLQSNVLAYADDGLGIGQTEGSIWKEQRRFYMSTVKNFGYGKMELEDFMHILLQNMIEDIRKLNEAFDPSIHISCFTCNVISEILCKKQFSKDDKKFLRITETIHGILEIFADSTYFLVGYPFEHGLMKFTSMGRRIRRIQKGVTVVAKEIVQEHIETFDDKNDNRDFIDSYLSHMKKLEAKGQLAGTSFSIQRLEMIFMNMLFEGTETTGFFLNAILLEIARHAEEQQKVQIEIDQVVGRTRLPSWRDRQNMPYTEAVVLELYRITWPLNFSSYYSNFEETSIHGYRIPKRSIIIFSFYTIYRDPKLFPEPEKFIPERFIGSAGERIKLEGPMPFGLGKRTCVGEPLAQMEVFLVFTAILQNFTLEQGRKKDTVVAHMRDKKS